MKEFREYERSQFEDKNKFYKEVFKAIEIEQVKDKERQLKGIDVVLHCRSGPKINIDEKER